MFVLLIDYKEKHFLYVFQQQYMNLHFPNKYIPLDFDQHSSKEFFQIRKINKILFIRFWKFTLNVWATLPELTSQIWAWQSSFVILKYFPDVLNEQHWAFV